MLGSFKKTSQRMAMNSSAVIGGLSEPAFSPCSSFLVLHNHQDELYASSHYLRINDVFVVGNNSWIKVVSVTKEVVRIRSTDGDVEDVVDFNQKRRKLKFGQCSFDAVDDADKSDPAPMKEFDDSIEKHVNAITLMVLNGSKEGKEFKISGDSGVIGSFATNDIVITEAGVLPVHAKIERDGASYVLRDLSHDTQLSTRVALLENVEITVGSMLLLGNTRLVVTEYGHAPSLLLTACLSWNTPTDRIFLCLNAPADRIICTGIFSFLT
jgi:hypothetical protein